MDVPQIDIVRAVAPAQEVRDADSDTGESPGTLTGHFSVFDTWYEVDSLFEGHFLERTNRGAFKQTIREDSDHVKVTFNHGYDVLGDQVLGPIDVLREDDVGPYYEVPLFRGVPDLIVDGLRAGVYGSSFRFRVTGEKWDDEPGESDHNPKGLPERTITRVRLMEFGPVTFPANPDATAGIRSLTDEYFERLQDRNPTKYEAAVRAAKASTGRPGTRSAGGGGTDDANPEDGAGASPQTATPTPPTPERTTVTATDTPMTAEERSARLGEIRSRLGEIDQEYAGSELPADVRAEWDDLEAERDQHKAALADIERRRASLASMADEPGNQEPTSPALAAPAARGGRPAPHAATRTAPCYDLGEIRSQARSVDDLPALYRDYALRAAEAARFPQRKVSGKGRAYNVTPEDARSQIEYLLEYVDDERGTLARRIIATMSPTYERAFGKVAVSLTTVGLTQEEQRALSLGVTTEGGFAVPAQLDPTIILTSNGAINPLRQISRVEQIVGKEWQGITSAGITVSRVAEATEAGDNAPTLAQPTVKAERVQGFVPFSIEIDQDWASMRAEMTRLLADAKDQEEAASFVTGTGVSPQANGLVATLNASSNVIANTFGVANLYALEEALPPRFRAQARFAANKAVYNLVRQFDTAGGANLWVRLTDGMPPELIGYPAHEVSSMVSTVSTIGNRFLLLGDFQQFLIVDRVGMSIELVPHLFGASRRPTGQRGLYAIWRNNSKILTDNAFRILHKAA